MKHTELIERLRAGSGGMKHWQELESEAADAIESLQAEIERLTSDRNLEKKLRKDSEERAYNAESERDALKLDAERYCVLRDSKYQLGEDDISVSDSSFNVFFEQDLDKAVDALRHRYEAVKGAA